ncbi:MAG: aldo/keto reductase [Candidatus Omnitrophica bacterium]|nr:aldo/keto reductase [Candidatus Omnitrophota bacterium]
MSSYLPWGFVYHDESGEVDGGTSFALNRPWEGFKDLDKLIAEYKPTLFDLTITIVGGDSRLIPRDRTFATIIGRSLGDAPPAAGMEEEKGITRRELLAGAVGTAVGATATVAGLATYNKLSRPAVPAVRIPGFDSSPSPLFKAVVDQNSGDLTVRFPNGFLSNPVYGLRPPRDRPGDQRWTVRRPFPRRTPGDGVVSFEVPRGLEKDPDESWYVIERRIVVVANTPAEGEMLYSASARGLPLDEIIANVSGVRLILDIEKDGTVFVLSPKRPAPPLPAAPAPVPVSLNKFKPIRTADDAETAAAVLYSATGVVAPVFSEKDVMSLEGRRAHPLSGRVSRAMSRDRSIVTVMMRLHPQDQDYVPVIHFKQDIGIIFRERLEREGRPIPPPKFTVDETVIRGLSPDQKEVLMVVDDKFYLIDQEAHMTEVVPAPKKEAGLEEGVIREFGGTGLQFHVLGAGTIWMGRPWTPDNIASYTYPEKQEIDAYLDQVFDRVPNRNGVVMIDTAASYGFTEEKLGEYFRSRPERFKRAFIATKWGEQQTYDSSKEIKDQWKFRSDYSVSNLQESVAQSMKYLGRIDLLYIHMVGGATADVFRDHPIVDEMVRMKKERHGGIRFLGASISGEEVLEEAVRENLLSPFDVIQMPGPVFLKRPDLVRALRADGKAIVLNSVIRKGDRSITEKESYFRLLNNPDVSMILTGSRNHYRDNMGYVEEWSRSKSNAAGLEERTGYGISRRNFLKAAAAGGITATLVPEFYGLAQAQISTGPVGALADLRKELGTDKQLGIIIWDPRDLFRLKDFFSLAVKTGVDVVWISGFRFRQLTAQQQQALLTQASQAGLKTLGFIDGNHDWAENRLFVASHYQDLTVRLARLNLGKLQIAFATDIEPYTQKGWKGDLKGYMDLLEGVILPRVQAFARQKRHPDGKSVVRGPLLTRFEPFWYENDHKTDSGVTVKGLRTLEKTEIAAMTYRDTAKGIADVSETVRARTKEEKVTFQIGVETIPEKEVGTPSFFGKETEIGPALLEAYKAMKDDRDRVGGVYIHTASPVTAHRILTVIVRAKSEMPGKPIQPAKEFGVKDDKATKFTALEITLDLLLPKELVGKELVGVPFIKTDSWYIQPFDNRKAMHRVSTKGRVTVKTVDRSPFKGKETVGRAVLIMEKDQFDEFLKTYKDKGAKEAAKRVLKIIEIDDEGKTKVVEKLSAGLEEVEARIAAATTQYEGLFKNGTELADDQVIPNLNVAAGKKITLEIDLNQLSDINPAAVAAIGRIFTHGEEIVPAVWRERELVRETLPLPPGLKEAEGFLAGKNAGATDLALVDPKVAGDDVEAWTKILEGRKTPGIVMTPAVLSALDKLRNTPRDLAVVLAAIRQAGGIVLGFEVEEKAGQRKLYLYA